MSNFSWAPRIFSTQESLALNVLFKLSDHFSLQGFTNDQLLSAMSIETLGLIAEFQENNWVEKEDLGTQAIKLLRRDMVNLHANSVRDKIAPVVSQRISSLIG